MIKTERIKMSPNEALDFTMDEIKTLTRHQKELMEELDQSTFGVKEDELVSEAYKQLDQAFLNAICRLANRAVKISYPYYEA